MSMTVGSLQHTYAAYQPEKTKKNAQVSQRETSREDYLKELQKKNPQINIMAGNPDRTVKSANGTGKTDVRISPKFLDKMKNDPQVASKYENMLSQIPALDGWANSMVKAMTGSEVKYRQVWIDDEGNMGSMAVTGPSETQKKIDTERKENQQKAFEERIGKAREKAKERTEQLEKILAKKMESSKNGELILNHEDMSLLLQAVGNRHIGKTKTGSNGYLDKRI